MNADAEVLAMHGGAPARARMDDWVRPGGLMLGEEERQSVLEVLDHHNLNRFQGRSTPGPSKVSQFEEAFARHKGSRHALAVTSGTAALITSLVAVGVGPGDEVIIPTFTYIASAGAVVAAKAVPILCEVDDTLTMDPADLERKITPRTKAVMPVHMDGVPCAMDRIMRVARERGLKVVEDTAQANGGSFQGRRLGTFGDAGAYSLQINKIITSGEGGVIITDDDEVYRRAWVYHDGGGTYARFGDLVDPFFGNNYRMNDLTGAVALAQLAKIDGIIAAMRERKAKTKEALAAFEGLTFRRLNDADGDTGVSIVFYLPTHGLALRFAEALRAENIGAFVEYDPARVDWHIYAHWSILLNKAMPTPEGCPFNCPLYPGKPEYAVDMCPQSLDYLGRAVHLQVNPLWTERDVDEIILGLSKVARALL